MSLFALSMLLEERKPKPRPPVRMDFGRVPYRDEGSMIRAAECSEYIAAWEALRFLLKGEDSEEITKAKEAFRIAKAKMVAFLKPRKERFYSANGCRFHYHEKTGGISVIRKLARYRDRAPATFKAFV